MRLDCKNAIMKCASNMKNMTYTHTKIDIPTPLSYRREKFCRQCLKKTPPLKTKVSNKKFLLCSYHYARLCVQKRCTFKNCKRIALNNDRTCSVHTDVSKKICNNEGCTNPLTTRANFCNRCYMRYWRLYKKNEKMRENAKMGVCEDKNKKHDEVRKKQNKRKRKKSDVGRIEKISKMYKKQLLDDFFMQFSKNFGLDMCLLKLDFAQKNSFYVFVLKELFSNEQHKSFLYDTYTIKPLCDSTTPSRKLKELVLFVGKHCTRKRK